MPKLSMREIRRHPAVITEPDDLQPGLEVAMCYLVPPIGRQVRCGQALMGLLANVENSDITRREAMKQGYNHTPTWGIVVCYVATVNWVNTTNHSYKHPYASLDVTQSTSNLTLAEELSSPATSIDEAVARIQTVPRINSFNINGDAMDSYELITGFENIGLAPEPYSLNHFVLNRAN